MESAWATVSFLLWLAVPVGYAILGYRFVRACRAELDRVRSYVDETYEDVADLLASQTGGKHRLLD